MTTRCVRARRRVRVEFTSEREARAVAGALGVDRELRPDVVRKTVTYERDGERWVVVGAFEASELRALRSAVSGFYDLLVVSVRTVGAFGEGSGQ